MMHVLTACYWVLLAKLIYVLYSHAQEVDSMHAINF
jgi:hypothetical protein